MNSETLIGYRKLLAAVIGMLATWAISKGMPAELANSAQGLLLEILPTALAVIFMMFNQKAKSTEVEKAKIAAGISTAPAPPKESSQPAEAPSSASSPSSNGYSGQGKIAAPTVDTMPPFEEIDSELTADIKKAIAGWYGKATSNPPTMPEIPKPEATLYTDIRERDAQRALQAQNAIAQEATKVFDGKELTEAYKLRKDCSYRVFQRINYHWDTAMHRWVDYFFALWQYQQL